MAVTVALDMVSSEREVAAAGKKKRKRLVVWIELEKIINRSIEERES